MRSLTVLLSAGSLVLGCGTTGAEGEPARTEVTAAESGRDESLASLLRRRFPSLRVDETASGIRLQIRQYDAAPLIVIDGTRVLGGAFGMLDGLRASEIVEVRVLKTMAETMVYGADAARGGVVEITTLLGQAAAAERQGP